MQSLVQPMDNNPAVYIFCESFVQLDNTIRVIEQNVINNNKSVILLGTESLYSLFYNVISKEYKNIEIIKLFSTTSRPNTAGLVGEFIFSCLDSIKRVGLLNKIYRTYFNHLNGADIYLFCQFFNANSYYLIKRIINQNRIHFIASRDYEEVNLEKVKITNIKYFIRNVLSRIVFGSGIDYVIFSHGGIASQINNKVFSKFYSCIPASGRQKWLNELQFNRTTFVSNEYDVIFYDFGYEIFNYITDVEHYNSIVYDVFSLLGRYFKREKICIKNHPTFKPSIELDKYGIIAPNYIPGEWYQRDNVLLLGIFSTCVYNSKKGIPVSLVNLFQYENKDIKTNFIAATLNRELEDSKVLIPANLEELDQIIKSRLAAESSEIMTASDSCHNGC